MENNDNKPGVKKGIGNPKGEGLPMPRPVRVSGSRWARTHGCASEGEIVAVDEVASTMSLYPLATSVSVRAAVRGGYSPNLLSCGLSAAAWSCDGLFRFVPLAPSRRSAQATPLLTRLHPLLAQAAPCGHGAESCVEARTGSGSQCASSSCQSAQRILFSLRPSDLRRTV